jgi:hypothetical protein
MNFIIGHKTPAHFSERKLPQPFLTSRKENKDSEHLARFWGYLFGIPKDAENSS